MIRLLNLLLLVQVVLFASCKRSDTTSDGPYPNEESLVLGVGGYGVEVKSAGVASSVDVFGTDKLAVYAISYIKDQPIAWPVGSNYFINTDQAYVAQADDAIKRIKKGDIVYYNPSLGPNIFPETRVAVYCVYPSLEANGVKLSVPTSAGTPPSAEVTLKTVGSDQYDIMIGSQPNLNRDDLPTGSGADIKRANITFQHTLAMLKVKIKADDTTPADALQGNRKLTSVMVNTNTTAEIADITATSNLYSEHATPDDITLYSKAEADAMQVPYSSDVDLDTKSLVDGQIMVFPTPSKITTITLTIDGNDYTVNVPDTYELKAGAINTITITANKLGVNIDDFTISKWNNTPDGSGNTEVADFQTNFSVKLKQGYLNTTAYTTAEDYYASVQINDVYWLETNDTHVPQIPCELSADGTFKFKESVSTLMLNDGEIYLSALKIFKKVGADYIPLFNAVATKNITPNIVIDKGTAGALKVNNKEVFINMDMQCLGDGTVSFPYEISDAIQLNRLRNFASSTAVTATYFIQLNDINLGEHLQITNTGVAQSPTKTLIGDAGGWVPVGNASAKFYGVYDGNNKTIFNVNISRTSTTGQGLFGAIAKPTDASSEVKNLTVTGYIAGAGQSAVLAGNVTGDARFTNCNVNAKIKVTSGSDVGGIVGLADGGTLELTNCQNNTTIASAIDAKGSNVGGLVGRINGAGTISGSVNNAEISSTGTSIGGIVGNATAATTTTPIKINDCVNNASKVVSTNSNVGGILGSGATNKIEISKSINNSTVSGISNYIGGIIGNMQSNTDIVLCQNTGSIKVSSTIVNTPGAGGLIGGISAASSGKIHQSINKGNVESDGSTTSRVGGLLGGNANSRIVTVTISESVNTGKVINQTGYVGGLMGFAIVNTSSYTITDCYNVGEIGSNGLATIGGLFGGAGADIVSIKNSYNAGIITRNGLSLSTALATEDGAFAGNFNQTDVTNVFTHSGVPILTLRTPVTRTDVKSPAVLTQLNNGRTIWTTDKTVNINGGLPILSWQ